MLTVGGHRNSLCAGELVDHHRVLVNDALRFDDGLCSVGIARAGRLDAELVKILVVVLHHEGQVFDVEVVAR